MLALGERKKEMSEYGKELQDISAEAFSHITIRGLRGSNTAVSYTHLTLPTIYSV